MTATTPRRRPARQGKLPGRQDWSSWPHYAAAAAGFRGYWYPVGYSSRFGGKPTQITLLGEKIVLIRDNGRVYALKDRCPHRGVPLSEGNQQFPGTISCPYHGWTFDLASGVLKAAITDGPASPICGKVTQPTYPVEERLGMVWVFVGDGEDAPPIDEQLPEELVDNAAILGSRIQPRAGNWRFACENGYDEGHAKYLHRTSLWRLFKPMPAWNETHIVRRGRWIFRVQEKQYWDADFPGLGRWSNQAWYKLKPPTEVANIGNTGSHRTVDPVIAAQEFPGFASVAMPGILRIVYPTFIHYEFYVPVDADNHLYFGVMANFERGIKALGFYAKYLGFIRWLFHGQFSAQDKWMVEVTDAPPERLYRPDDSLLKWRKLADDTSEERVKRLQEQGVDLAGT
ncbi:MAG TPA: Rieske 2Fe-2S domain-containing protein [Pseudonocardiaceae bacterium]|jgi:phenylpropionate dioxygenase-like ring-hydroxylating dioxygenase large terminal subunit|nr:Rieske 2Fe-2S domain-containing protein [Pseudonocardiaceae bacterium]